MPQGDVAAEIVRHARLSHRLRVEVEPLLGDPELARRIEAVVAERPGVTNVRADPRSGRVLIELGANAPILDELEKVVANRTAVAAHDRSIEDVVAALSTDRQLGLSAAEARERLSTYGANVLDQDQPPSRWVLLGAQIANLPSALLLGSAAISFLFGDVVEASAIVTVIGLNAAIGYRMERTTERLLESWRVAEVGNATVIRDGHTRRVRAAELVPGDLLVFGAGDIVPADARITDAHRLAVDEAPLTGESEPVGKRAASVANEAALAERTSMIFRGTTIASGHGRAIVTATGAATELAVVQRMAARANGPKVQLAARLAALSSRLAAAGIAASGVAALASLAWRQRPIEVARGAIALAVASIPEGLPVAATAAVVRAMARMREHGIIVRRLATAETLGGVTVVCTDKTGTLTENDMRLEAVWLGGTRIAASDVTGAFGPIPALLAAAVLNSDLDVQASGELVGSSTERALATAALHARLSPRALRRLLPRHRLVERTDETRYVISEHTTAEGDTLAFVKGAPEQVAELCGVDGEVVAANRMLAAEGLRVLGVGVGRNGSWRFLGLVALRDPLRAGSADAVAAAANAGIRTVILTGDQRGTAAAIAGQVGLAGEVIEACELPGVLADRARLRRIAVVARVTPADKVAVVDALRRAGEIVAMAGDGINDAPALKAADVGIAVGANATDLARQTADVVLASPDLRAITNAVAEGRIVQDNLRRSIRFQAAGNLGEVLLVVASSLAGRQLIPSMGLLWINLLTDTLPGLALVLEPGDPAVLDRPPATPGAPILDRADWKRVLRDGALMAGTAGIAAIVGGPLAAFAAIGAVQFGYATTCRAPGAPADRTFRRLVGSSAALHAAAVAASPLRRLLRIQGSVPLALGSFAVALGAPMLLSWRRHEITRRKELA